jgi:hypothetical protein
MVHNVKPQHNVIGLRYTFLLTALTQVPPSCANNLGVRRCAAPPQEC